MGNHLDRPFSQMGTDAGNGHRYLSPSELAKLFENPKFKEAAELAIRAGGQFNGKNAAAQELLFRNSKQSELHKQEENRAIKFREERSKEYAKFL